MKSAGPTIEGPRVWVLENDQPTPKPVTVGSTDGQRTEITSDAVQPGTRVLTDLAETSAP